MSKLLFLAVVGLAISSAAQSPPPSPTPTESSEKYQYSSRDNQPNAQIPNSTAQSTPASKNQSATHPAKTNVNSEGPPKRDESPVNWWVVFNAALLTIFNGALAWIGWKQYHSMRQQISIAKNSADAAKKSADAATDAIAHAKNSTAVTERAVILIESVVAEPQIGLAHPYFHGSSVLIFTLKNYGSTVAHDVRVKGQVKFSGSFPLAGAQGVTIAPQGHNQWITISFSNRMSQEEIDRINAGSQYLNYGIDVTYIDAFGKSHHYMATGQYIAVLRGFVTGSSTSD